MNLHASLKSHGFTYSELREAAGLQRLDNAFLDSLARDKPALAQRLASYRAGSLNIPATEISEFLLALAPFVESFIGQLFGITPEIENARRDAKNEAIVFDFKKAFVQRRARRFRGAVSESFATLDTAIKNLIGNSTDKELAVAQYGVGLLADEQSNAAAIEQLTKWCVLALTSDEGRTATVGWPSFKLVQRVDHTALVPLKQLENDALRRSETDTGVMRKRDGFVLTDNRMSSRAVQNEVHYCIYCHDHDGDFCSKGFPEKKGQPELGFKTDPLGVLLTGCPLEERISEMHLLKRDGNVVAALAMAMIDNPMIPATGHRICNDCMKGCIYQKQDPVNIPEIETRILTDVLDLPWGVEIYDLLTRWNPLRQTQYVEQPYNGYKVLIAGMGPAGFTMAHHLTMEGCAVVGIDGLKIEPLPREILDQPVREWSSLVESLDERILLGFGGVAEYGITVRWDKNFLKLIYLTLSRRPTFQVFGGVRFGGTVTVENAWQLGFDHICVATGAGLPRVVPMGNSLARGMRQASDFLMALQLTGAGKQTSLANLQVRLPAVVIGGGLTAVDTATEVQAYYIKQVEKITSRHEILVERMGEAKVLAGMNDEDKQILQEFLAHGRNVKEERTRAAKDNRPANFVPLLRSWGGVTLAYRKDMTNSPAYTRNHEELIKALEEGLFYAEGVEPLRVELDNFAHVAKIVFRQNGQEVTLPSRAVFIAAGAVPNIIYEQEHPGTFTLQGNHFLQHRDDDGTLREIPHASHIKDDNFGPFTSYAHDGHTVSYLGDTHPVFQGNVVKAIASSKRSYPHVMQSIQRSTKKRKQDSYENFRALMQDMLTPRVAEVRKDNPAMIELWIKAPMAARNFKPGQFFRLQTFESLSPIVKNTRLQIPVLTVSGTGVKDDMIRLMVLQWGTAPRLVGRLRAGDPVVLMGPTGSPTHLGDQETVLVIAGRWGAAVMLDIGHALRDAGNKVIYVAAFTRADEVDHQDQLEQGADQIIWCTAAEPKIQARRPQDISLVASDMLAVIRQYGDGKLYDTNTFSPLPLTTVDRIMVMGSTGLLRSFQTELRKSLQHYFKKDVLAFGTVGSPMQCMMKGVCAQCLQWQIDPATGKRTRAVFSCAQQDQPLEWIDLDNLTARQNQNRLTDRLSAMWLDHVLS